MHFLQSSMSLSLVLLVSSAMAGISRRQDNFQGPKLEGNACTSGTRLCCTLDDGVNNCSPTEAECNDAVICCNNDIGRQICVGEIDFNVPINIAVSNQSYEEENNYQETNSYEEEHNYQENNYEENNYEEETKIDNSDEFDDGDNVSVF